MELRKQNVTQTAIHVPQGERESLGTVGQLLTFKIHGDQSETVGIFEIEDPPEVTAPPRLYPTQDETHYILEGQFEFVLGERKMATSSGSVVYVPRTTVHTNMGTVTGEILFNEAPAGPFECFMEETGEPVTDPSSPQGLPQDMDKPQASALQTGGVELVMPSEETGP